MIKIHPDWPWVRRAKKRKLAKAREIMSLVVNRSLDKAGASSLLSSLQTLKLTPQEFTDEILLLLLAGHHTPARPPLGCSIASRRIQDFVKT